jgi:hypothetical protein
VGSFQLALLNSAGEIYTAGDPDAGKRGDCGDTFGFAKLQIEGVSRFSGVTMFDDFMIFTVDNLVYVSGSGNQFQDDTWGYSSPTLICKLPNAVKHVATSNYVLSIITVANTLYMCQHGTKSPLLVPLHAQHRIISTVDGVDVIVCVTEDRNGVEKHFHLSLRKRSFSDVIIKTFTC